NIFAEDSPSCCMLPVTQWDHKSFIVIDAGSTFFEPRYCSNANGSSCKCTNPAGQAPGINPPGGGPSTFSGGTMLVGRTKSYFRDASTNIMQVFTDTNND